MSKKRFEDEIELKNYLDELGIRYGDDMITANAFIIYIRDNKGGTNIVRGVYNTPIEAIRSIQSITEKFKLPVDDIDILLVGCLDQIKNEYKALDCLLSPFIYFKTPEETVENKKSE